MHLITYGAHHHSSFIILCWNINNERIHLLKNSVNAKSEEQQKNGNFYFLKHTLARFIELRCFLCHQYIRLYIVIKFKILESYMSIILTYKILKR